MSRKRKQEKETPVLEFFPDSTLTVYPTDDESQYESFQAIFGT